MKLGTRQAGPAGPDRSRGRVDRERTHCEWWLLDTVSERRLDERFARAFRTRAGRADLEPVYEPGAAMPAAPAPAP